MIDLISRHAVINGLASIAKAKAKSDAQKSMMGRAMFFVEQIPSAQPEPLTDKEQRIFLAAMGREENVCKQVDEEYKDCQEPYEDSLVKTCHEIVRKVRESLWT